MDDRLTPECRIWNMSRIQGKDTTIEVKIRIPFCEWITIQKKRYPGTPDVVLHKYHTVIFINTFQSAGL